MTGKGPVDPADLPDTPWRAPAIVQPGVAVAPLEVPVKLGSGGALSLDGNLDAVLHDDHTEDTPPTAVPGHFGYTAEELLARMMEDEDDDAEETALRKPVGVTAVVPFRPEPEDEPVAAAAPTPAPALPAAPAPITPIPVTPAPQALQSGSVQIPMWLLVVLLLVIGGLAGVVLTLFVATL